MVHVYYSLLFPLLKAWTVSSNLNLSYGFTIFNKTHIVCLTDDQDLSVYFSPPTEEEPESTSMPLLLSGWTTKNSSDSYFGPVRDKRWEGFRTAAGDSLLLTSLDKSLALSIYHSSSDQVEFFLHNDDILEFVTVNQDSDQWNHYYFRMENQKMYFFKNSELWRSVIDFVPTNFFFRTNNTAYFKLHDYTWQYSDTISTEPSVLLRNKTGSCLILYVSLCPDCFLTISTNNGRNEFVRSLQTQEEFKWMSYKFLYQDGETSINIHRSRSNISEQGFWGVDIRKCPPKSESGNVIYERNSVSLKPETLCHTLTNNKRKSENLVQDKDFLPEETGNNCSQLLNDEYCKAQKICDKNGNCSCTWGYEVDEEGFCTKKCDDGKWGQNCQKICDCDRKLCDNVRGCLPKKMMQKSASVIVSGMHYYLFLDVNSDFYIKDKDPYSSSRFTVDHFFGSFLFCKVTDGYLWFFRVFLLYGCIYLEHEKLFK